MPMLPVPVPILTRFEAILEKRAVAPIQRAVSLYFEMQRKGQTPVADFHSNKKKPSVPEPQQIRESSPSFAQSIRLKTTSPPVPAQRPPWRRWEDGYAVQSASPEWDAAIAELAAEIKTRHYSRNQM